MADKKEKDFGSVNDCEFIRALDVNGNSVKVSKIGIAKLMESTMSEATENTNGIVSSALFKVMFTAHSDNTYDFSDPNLPTGCYGINKDHTTAGINAPSEAPGYGVLLHIRKFSGGNGGNPAVQLYIRYDGLSLQIRAYWAGQWSPMRVISIL